MGTQAIQHRLAVYWCRQFEDSIKVLFPTCRLYRAGALGTARGRERSHSSDIPPQGLTAKVCRPWEICYRAVANLEESTPLQRGILARGLL